jgi:hypothetical protein
LPALDLHTRALAIIEAVLDLPPLPNEPRFIEASDRINRVCRQYILSYQTERDALRQRSLRKKLRPEDLGRRIAELDGSGLGVRQIARILGVNPSTVSRRLRRTQ